MAPRIRIFTRADRNQDAAVLVGERITPFAAVKKPLGLEYSALLKKWNATHTASFSFHHMYSRKDSQWPTRCEAPMEDDARRFRHAHGEFTPGYFSSL